MSSTVVDPPAERVEHPPLAISNVPGRLGSLPVNKVLAITGLPWQRRLAKAALQIAHIRHWEKQYLTLNDADLLRTSQELRGKARGKYSLDKLDQASGFAPSPFSAP